MGRTMKLAAVAALGASLALTGCSQEDRSYELGLCQEFAKDYYFTFDWGSKLEVSQGRFEGNSTQGKIRGEWKGVTWVDQTPVRGNYECEVVDGEVRLIDEGYTFTEY